MFPLRDLSSWAQNLAKREKKQYSFGISLTAPTVQPWRNPVYNVGTWYVAIIGTQGTQFAVSVNVTKCAPGFVGYVTDRRSWTHACAARAPPDAHVFPC